MCAANMIGDEGAVALASALKSGKTRLKTVFLLRPILVIYAK